MRKQRHGRSGERRYRIIQRNSVRASLATVALVCAVLALPLWLLSFSWVPFAMMGRPVGPFRYVIVAAEVGALLAASLGTGLGVIARRRARVGTAGRRRATGALMLGIAAVVFLVGFNVLGLIFGP